MSSKELFMGIDAGTTKIRALIFDDRGTLISQASDTPKIYHSHVGWAYYDPKSIWITTARVIKKALSYIDKPERVISVGVASVGETAIILNKNNKPIYQSIAWYDKRAKDQSDRIEKKLGSNNIFKITGLIQEPIFGINKMLWLKEKEREVYAQSNKWLIIADYINWKLCGEQATDYSLACRTLALDLSKLQYSDSIIKNINIKKNLFPELRPSASKLGAVNFQASKETGLSQGCVVGIGGHDHMVGGLITRSLQIGKITNSVGSAEAIMTGIEKPSQNLAFKKAGIVEGVISTNKKNYYYLFGSMFTACAAIDWIKLLVARNESYEKINYQINKLPIGSNGIIFYPHLRIGSPPNPIQNTRGAFSGLSTDTDKYNIIRSVYEGISFDAKNALDVMQKILKIKIKTILMTGGGSQNTSLVNIRANIFNANLKTLNIPESVSLGAAFCGATAKGYFSSMDEAIKNIKYKEKKIYPNKKSSKKYLKIYNKLYLPGLKNILHTNKLAITNKFYS